MTEVRPIFKKILIVAIVLYVVSVTYALADIYTTLGRLDHKMMHLAGGEYKQGAVHCSLK